MQMRQVQLTPRTGNANLVDDDVIDGSLQRQQQRACC